RVMISPSGLNDDTNVQTMGVNQRRVAKPPASHNSRSPIFSDLTGLRRITIAATSGELFSERQLAHQGDHHREKQQEKADGGGIAHVQRLELDKEIVDDGGADARGAAIR